MSKEVVKENGQIVIDHLNAIFGQASQSLITGCCEHGEASVFKYQNSGGDKFFVCFFPKDKKQIRFVRWDINEAGEVENTAYGYQDEVVYDAGMAEYVRNPDQRVHDLACTEAEEVFGKVDLGQVLESFSH